MSTTTTPIMVAAGTQAQLVQPGGGQYGAVVIANMSQFELTVQIGANTADLQPFTAQLYTLEQSQQSPVNLNPYLPAGATFVSGQPNQVSATWYKYGEKPQGSWPFSFTGQAIQTGINGAINVQQTFQSTLLADAVVVGGSAITTPLAISAYASLIIEAFVPTGAGSVVLQLLQTAGSGITAVDSFYVTSEDTQNNGIIAVQVPVVANFLQVHNRLAAGNNCQYLVYGTNRLVGSRRYMGWNRPPHAYALNQAVTGGLEYGVPQTDLPAGEPIPVETTFNGLYEVSIGTNIDVNLFLRYLLPSGVTTDILVGNLKAANSPASFIGYFEGNGRFIVEAGTTGTIAVSFIVTEGASVSV